MIKSNLITLIILILLILILITDNSVERFIDLKQYNPFSRAFSSVGNSISNAIFKSNREENKVLNINNVPFNESYVIKNIPSKFVSFIKNDKIKTSTLITNTLYDLPGAINKIKSWIDNNGEILLDNAFGSIKNKDDILNSYNTFNCWASKNMKDIIDLKKSISGNLEKYETKLIPEIKLVLNNFSDPCLWKLNFSRLLFSSSVDYLINLNNEVDSSNLEFQDIVKKIRNISLCLKSESMDLITNKIVRTLLTPIITPILIVSVYYCTENVEIESISDKLCDLTSDVLSKLISTKNIIKFPLLILTFVNSYMNTGVWYGHNLNEYIPQFIPYTENFNNLLAIKCDNQKKSNLFSFEKQRLYEKLNAMKDNIIEIEDGTCESYGLNTINSESICKLTGNLHGINYTYKNLNNNLPKGCLTLDNGSIYVPNGKGLLSKNQKSLCLKNSSSLILSNDKCESNSLCPQNKNLSKFKIKNDECVCKMPDIEKENLFHIYFIENNIKYFLVKNKSRFIISTEELHAETFKLLNKDKKTVLCNSNEDYFIKFLDDFHQVSLNVTELNDTNLNLIDKQFQGKKYIFDNEKLVNFKGRDFRAQFINKFTVFKIYMKSGCKKRYLAKSGNSFTLNENEGDLFKITKKNDRSLITDIQDKYFIRINGGVNAEFISNLVNTDESQLGNVKNKTYVTRDDELFDYYIGKYSGKFYPEMAELPNKILINEPNPNTSYSLSSSELVPFKEIPTGSSFKIYFKKNHIINYLKKLENEEKFITTTNIESADLFTLKTENDRTGIMHFDGKYNLNLSGNVFPQNSNNLISNELNLIQGRTLLRDNDKIFHYLFDGNWYDFFASVAVPTNKRNNMSVSKSNFLIYFKNVENNNMYLKKHKNYFITTTSTLEAEKFKLIQKDNKTFIGDTKDSYFISLFGDINQMSTYNTPSIGDMKKIQGKYEMQNNDKLFYYLFNGEWKDFYAEIDNEKYVETFIEDTDSEDVGFYTYQGKFNF